MLLTSGFSMTILVMYDSESSNLHFNQIYTSSYIDKSINRQSTPAIRALNYYRRVAILIQQMTNIL